MTGWYGTGSAAGSVDESTDTPTLFAQTMGLVAATAGFFALGAYVAGHPRRLVARPLDASLACLVAMNFAVRASEGITTG